MRAPTTACPASGYATSSFCAADRVAVPPFFSSPTMTRSTAPSISSQPTVDLAIRAAEIAASFIRFSSWAPLNPGVRRAIASRSTSGSSGLPRECTPRIRARPLKSGRATLIFLSKRPGRKRALARISTRFVAAIVMILGSHQTRPFQREFDSGFAHARLPFTLRFFLIAIIFLVFDVELILIFPFLANMLMATRVVANYIIYFLLVILILGLSHEWNQGSLEWAA